MWATRLIVDEADLEDPNTKAATVLRELGVYILFLLVISACK